MAGSLYVVDRIQGVLNSISAGEDFPRAAELDAQGDHEGAAEAFNAGLDKMTPGTAPGGGKTFETYTNKNPGTGQVYSWRTSGTGSPLQNVAERTETLRPVPNLLF